MSETVFVTRKFIILIIILLRRKHLVSVFESHFLNFDTKTKDVFLLNCVQLLVRQFHQISIWSNNLFKKKRTTSDQYSNDLLFHASHGMIKLIYWTQIVTATWKARVVRAWLSPRWWVSLWKEKEKSWKEEVIFHLWDEKWYLVLTFH
jgi:hypothetical protein